MTEEIRDAQLSLPVFDLSTRVDARPFLKWAGGKSQLLPAMAWHFPENASQKRYFEPFLGGGAVFFHLQPTRAILSDISAALIEVYTVVRDHVEELIASLMCHRNDRDHYYSVRAADPDKMSPIQRASRLIFLNRTCYNGLYRVNSKGQFNVPFGDYRNPRICDAEGLRAASLALQNAELRVGDFEAALADCRAGDFVYMDPPYQPLSRTSSFTDYTAGGFTERDQWRLANTYRRLDSRGVMLMLSNSDTTLIRDLYTGYRIVELLASRAINCRGQGRGPVTELLIMNY